MYLQLAGSVIACDNTRRDKCTISRDENLVEWNVNRTLNIVRNLRGRRNIKMTFIASSSGRSDSNNAKFDVDNIVSIAL